MAAKKKVRGKKKKKTTGRKPSPAPAPPRPPVDDDDDDDDDDDLDDDDDDEDTVSGAPDPDDDDSDDDDDDDDDESSEESEPEAEAEPDEPPKALKKAEKKALIKAWFDLDSKVHELKAEIERAEAEKVKKAEALYRGGVTEGKFRGEAFRVAGGGKRKPTLRRIKIDLEDFGS